MNFYSLQSILGATKARVSMRSPSDSFNVTAPRSTAYIEPTFTKIEFEVERPQVLLISAVGATGKTTLAQVLSNRSGLPLLDLAKHKPVGDNTLTGLLTGAFAVSDLAAVFGGIGDGTYGVIVDGVDEARSKTTEKAFEAFLDDVAKLCEPSPTTSFVLLGRTQVLEDCWLYLDAKGIQVGLVEIAPFDLQGARDYIDAFVVPTGQSPSKQYQAVRDEILGKLGAAFTHEASGDHPGFLSFIGYPPVLEAIVALLKDEQNYFGLLTQIGGDAVNGVEIELVHKIVAYILRREREQKVVPNIVTPLIAALPAKQQGTVLSTIFDAQEQSVRLLSHCLGVQPTLKAIGEQVIDEQYEAQLVPWIVGHPFLTGRTFRSSVFEAATLATLMASGLDDHVRLALAYADCHKSNYHVIYLLRHLSGDRRIPISCLRVILGSAMELRSKTTSVDLVVEGGDCDEFDAAPPDDTVSIQIEARSTRDLDDVTAFEFFAKRAGIEPVHLGPRLASAQVWLSGEVIMSGAQELELIAPVDLTAGRVVLQAGTLVLRHPPGSTDKQVMIECETLGSSLTSILTNDVDLTISVSDRSGITYPAVQFLENRAAEPSDPALREKFLRLKRILLHFRSHSKGALAKFRHKIEHERVLGATVGPPILERLLRDQILMREGKFYFLDPINVHKHLGVSYESLKKGQTSEQLLDYLRAIPGSPSG